MIIEQLFSALATLLTLSHLAHLTFGVCLGLVIGILPGLGGLAGLALLLPFVFGMEPGHALAMMLGLQSVTATSDTFPAVLMGIPGTSGSQATTVDGFQMSKKGQAARGLAAAFSASLFGGIFGAVVLTGAVFVAESLILSIGFGERMMLTLLAFTMVGMLTGQSAMKGFVSIGVGLVLGAIGAAPSTGVVRLGLGTEYLIEPIKIIIMGLALFALPEIIDILRTRQRISDTQLAPGQTLQGIKDTMKNWWLALRCSAIGAGLGALPGLGGSVVDWVAYGHAIQTTPNRERYGTGDVRGVIAPEASNNAKEGGALIPTILFGIPGSGSMAILLGGFFLIGIDPGIEMVVNHLDLVYLMIWSVAAANIIGAGLCLGFAGQISKLTTIRYTILAPFMIAIIYFAAFQATRDWGDLIMLTILGAAGIYFKRFGWSRPAILIGFVLSDLVESSVYRTVSAYGMEVFTRPLVLILGALVLLSIFVAFKFGNNKIEPAGERYSPANRRPQLIFLGVIAILPIALLGNVWSMDRLTNMFPILASGVTLLFIAILTIQSVRTKKPAAIFFDLEAVPNEEDAPKFGIPYFLLWLLGLLGLSALFGFVLGVSGFLFAFLRLKARCRYWVTALSTLGFIFFLGGLSNLLVLKYPQGLLQLFVSLPWPLQ